MKSDFYSRYSLFILAVTLFMLPIAFAGARRALDSNTNEVEQWLPDTYEETRVFKEFRDQFVGEKFVLVSWDGCTVHDDRLTMLADKLMAGQKGSVERPEYFSEVLTGPSVIKQLTSDPVNLSRDEAIERLSGALIGPDGERTCMVLSVSDQGKARLRPMIEYIYSTAANECNIPRDDLHLGGPPSDNVAIDEAGEQSLTRLASLAGLIGLTVSWWCLRSFKLVIIVLIAGVYSAMAALAVVWYSGVNMNAILLTMPSLVYVAAISGAIHLANYYRDAIHEHGVEGAAGRAIAHAWLPLSLATGTTAVGLLSLCYSELVPIQLFGLYSAIGVIVSVLFQFFFLPAAFETFPLRTERKDGMPSDSLGWLDPAFFKGWNNVGQWIVDHNGLAAAACILVMVVCGYGMTKMQTSVQLMRLFSPKAKVVTDYEWLEQQLGPLVPMEVVVNFDKQACKLSMLERMELVESVQQAVAGIDAELPRERRRMGTPLSAITFAPPLDGEAGVANAEGEAKPSRSTGVGRMGRLMGRFVVKDRERTERDIRSRRLAEHRDEFLAGDYMAETDATEMWRISARLSALQDVDYAKFVADIRAVVDPLIGNQRTSGVDGVSVTYTGLVPLIYKAQNSLLDGLAAGFVMDMVLIVVAIIIAMRAFSAGVLLCLPSMFPAVVVFGIMGWLGIIVDIGTVMTPAVALGVSVDDIVHFMLQYRRALADGLDRKAAVMMAYKHCARPMYQSWGVIGLGLSVFAFSPFTPTQRFGYMMISLLTAALAGSLVLLPALLAGPVGGSFARGVHRAAAKKRAQVDVEVDAGRSTPPRPKRPLAPQAQQAPIESTTHSFGS